MDWEVVFQLTLAVFFGALVGIEREIKGKEAGLQTYSLVSLGSCLFVLVGLKLFGAASGAAILLVATGVGFIGAGVIMHREDHTEGITTAAGLWCMAAIGVTIGARLYLFSLVALVLISVILIGFGLFERKALNNKK